MLVLPFLSYIIESGVVYLCLAEKGYPKRLAFQVSCIPSSWSPHLPLQCRYPSLTWPLPVPLTPLPHLLVLRSAAVS